jgi:hypothetical protein
MTKPLSLSHAIIGLLVEVKEAPEELLHQRFRTQGIALITNALQHLVVKQLLVRTPAGAYILNPKFIK